MKQLFKWFELKTWCLDHPGQAAMMVTPAGTFTVIFTKASTVPLKGVDRP